MNALVASTQTNGMPMDLEMDSELLDMLGWRGFWSELNDAMQRELRRSYRVRPLLPQFGDERLDPDAIANYIVELPPPPATLDYTPVPIKIPTLPRLVSAEIGCQFRLTNDQVMNAQAVRQLSIKAAHNVALAEDALLLFGKDLSGKEPEPTHTRREYLRLSIDQRNLDEQDRRLIRPSLSSDTRAALRHLLEVQTDKRVNAVEAKHKLKEALKSLPGTPELTFRQKIVNAVRDSNDPVKLRLSQEGLDDVEDTLAGRFLDDSFDRDLKDELVRLGLLEYVKVSDQNRSRILDVVLQGIEELQERGHYGEYYALVAPDLYEAAYAPQGEDISSAPIYQILPRLGEGGFGYSMMVPPGMGVMWSSGGDAIGVAVPREAHLTFIRKDKDVILSVQERVRLIINEPRAVVQLRDPESTLVQKLHTRVDEIAQKLDREMGDANKKLAGLSTDVNGVRTDLNNTINGLHADLNKADNEIRMKLDTDIGSVRAELREHTNLPQHRPGEPGNPAKPKG